MQTTEKQVWFPAKKYGWGWGFPCSWQGWVTIMVWLALVAGGSALLMPGRFGIWITWLIVLGAALFTVCLLKGEKPRWRWGKD
ncbi:MAG: hypothetical protein DRR42_17400 [Gammaproteobacteria bacterium]|nr:MAG: hypothetical protein DRR42_17400 [Gammaproteobacteria bacterium]